MTALIVLAAIAAFFALGWFLNHIGPTVQAHEKERDRREREMLSVMTPRQRRHYYQRDRERHSNHGSWTGL